MHKYLSIIIIACGFLSCGEDSSSDYKTEIKAHRKEITKKFLIRESSPLEDKDRTYFVGLNYFEIKPEYKVWAQIQKETRKINLSLSTTGERMADYNKYGLLNFELNGKKLQLQAFSTDNEEGTTVFVPFADLSNGKSTYESGRYIDLALSDSNYVVLDFNKAYNPYCAYNKDYSCVVPPPENRLDIMLEAGEMKYH